MKGNIFTRRPATAISVSVLILIAGFISLFSLPVEQYPDIAPPTVQVSTSYTGADANAVQQSVIMPLEEAINGVEHMIYMTSEASNDGSASIQVFFKQGTDPDMAAVNVQNRVARAQGLLPAEVTQVGVTSQKRQNSFLKIAGLEATGGRYDENFVANYLEINVFPRIKRVEGVGDVQAYSNTYSMRVWLKPDVMAQYGLQPSDITAAIGQQNIVAPVGSLGESSPNVFQYTVKYKGRLSDAKEFENIVIRSEQNGNVLRLKDVAEVELGALSYNYAGIINGHPGVNFMVYPVSGVNMTEVNRQVTELMDEIAETLPEGLRFVTLMDTNDFLFESINEVVVTLIMAIILVVLVVYFFLQDLKSTLIPSITIVVSLIGTFACLQLAGFSINILTLFALVLAIGTVVDNAIVVVEAVQTKFDAGYKSPYLATRDAMGDVTMAIVSCTLVFMAIFIPVTFMGGTAGIFYTQFGITMAVAVGISLICALVLCPALCVLIMRPSKEEKSNKSITMRVRTVYNTSYNVLLSRYKRSVLFFIRRRWMVWSSLVIVVALLGYLLNTTRTGLVPQEDKGLIMMSVGTSPGNSLVETSKAMDKVQAIIEEIPEVTEYARIDGYGTMAGSGTSYGTFFLTLKHWSQREGKEHNIDAVLERLNSRLEGITEAEVFALQDGMIPGYGNGNAIELNLQDRTGGDMTTFYETSMRFLEELNKRPEVGSSYCSYAMNFPQYDIDVDAAKCMRAGTTPSEVLDVLGNYTGGSYVSNFNRFGKVYRVMTQAAPEYRLDERSLQNLYVRIDGKMAPISQFVTLRKTNGPEVSNRFNLFSSIQTSVNVAEGYSSGQAMEAITEVAAATLPAGYGYEYGGISREEAGGSSSTLFIYVLCVVLVYFILVCLYESFFVPLAVILSVPFGIMGSFLFARLFSLENNIYLQTGVIMLIGLLGKTAILITEFATERRREGMSIVEAAYSAAQVRFRPILMTVLTMVFGMLPLMFSTGAGANGNNALGTGAVGGMLVGTLAILFTVPAFFVVFQWMQERFVPRRDYDDKKPMDPQVMEEHENYLASQSAFNPDKEK